VQNVIDHARSRGRRAAAVPEERGRSAWTVSVRLPRALFTTRPGPGAVPSPAAGARPSVDVPLPL